LPLQVYRKSLVGENYSSDCDVFFVASLNLLWVYAWLLLLGWQLSNVLDLLELLLSLVLCLIKLLLDSLLLGLKILSVLCWLEISLFLNLKIMFLKSVFEVFKLDISNFNSVAKVSLKFLLELLEVSLVLWGLSLNDLLHLLFKLDVVDIVIELLLSLLFSSLKFLFDLFKCEILVFVEISFALKFLLNLEIFVGELLVVLFAGNVDQESNISVFAVFFFFEHHLCWKSKCVFNEKIVSWE